MNFLNPIYLWSLLGIFIPIAIHLWSRRKVTKIKVGSIKLLQDSEPRQTSTLQPNEVWLLLLRVLTIILAALLLAGPQLVDKTANSKLLYVISPLLIDNQKMKNLLEDIPEEAIRVLDNKFSKVTEYDGIHIDASVTPNYWQLAQKLNTLQADSIVVLTKGFRSGIKGKRPVIPSHINWLVLNSNDTSDHILEAKKKGDSLELLTILSNEEKLHFEKKKFASNDQGIEFNTPKDSVRINDVMVPIRLEEPINILLVYHDSLSREQEYIVAVYQAIAKFMEQSITIETTTKSDSVNFNVYDASIWLGVKPEESIMKRRLIYQPDPLATQLIVQGTRENEYFLTRLLNSENIVEGHLPEKLFAILNSNDNLKERIQSYDKRLVAVDELKSVAGKKAKKVQRASLVDISNWLWALLFLIIVIERIIANYRKQ